ncbi:prephenate dehydrogenase [Brevibacterium litoralis]|uniref:prephenate dehydrogenase n=1 Tax=Brevibacterium litoralis TaxID=3138935 RepID=UPI0032EF6EDE
MTHVHIVGTGLLGTSLGLALTTRSTPDDPWTVTLEDASPTACRLAADMGAGRALVPGADTAPEAPDLVVVCVPPDVAGPQILRALRTWPAATVTDVASVKSAVLAAVRAGTVGDELDRYIGSHPMAGRERSGAIAARADLFTARPWVVCSDEETPADRLALVVRVAEVVGASVVHLDPDFHDASVARVSHAPQVVSSLLASQLRDMPVEGVALAGQGLRDVTRIAASDPGLWTQILSGNATEVRQVLVDLRGELDAVIGALGAAAGESAAGAGTDGTGVAGEVTDGVPDGAPRERGSAGAPGTGPGPLAVIAGALAAGNEGHDRIPGKHGAAPQKFTEVTVYMDDRPGSLARLFADIDALGINVEDVRMDHAPGIMVGSVDVSVLPGYARDLVEGLTDRGWWLPEAEIGGEE